MKIGWGLTDIQTGCLGAMLREQSQTALNRCGMLVFKIEYDLECFKSYDIYLKIMYNVVFAAFSPFVVYQNM